VLATVVHGLRDVRVEEVPDARVEAPHDALVRVTHALVCGSDLWTYRGFGSGGPGSRIGHEFAGVVEAVGGDVESVRPGDRVLSPFTYSDGTCAHCREGWTTSCTSGGFFGTDTDGGQGEAVRVPQADGTLVVLPTGLADGDPLVRALLPLTDVMATGHHAAVSAGVRSGSTAVVVGDGAVGLCGVLAAGRLGAERVIAVGHHPDRLELARRFGATDVVTARGPDAVREVRALTAGARAHGVLECVGNQEAMETAVGCTRDGGTVGFVGVPHEVAALPVGAMFSRNVGLRGGVAPVRRYLPDLLADVLAGRLDPSPVLDLDTDLAGVPDAYAAMDARRATKALVRVG